MQTPLGGELVEMADGAPALIWLTDPEQNGVWFNRRWLDYTGRARAEAVGRGWQESLHPDDRERCLETYAHACQAGRPFEMEFRLRQAQGSYGWIADAGKPRRDAQGRLIGYLRFGWDVTAHKLTEQALQESALHTQATLDNALDGIITIDDRGLIQSFNRAAAGIFGYTPQETLGRNVSMLMPEPYRSQHDRYLQNYQSSGVPRIIGIGREVEGRRKDGTVFPMELAVSQIWRKGRPMYVGLARDITERKRIERMKAEFVSTVSHELRTPLTSISGALGLLAGGALGELPDKAAEMVAIAHRNSLRLARLINDLLDLEKLAAGKLTFEPKPQPLMPLVEQAMEAIRVQAGQRGIQCVLRAREDGAWVRVDGMRTQQILVNFLSNAVKFSPAGASVELTVDICRHGAVRVTVCDQGPGIPADFRDRLFQRFAQADASDARQAEGSGLGLAISKELAESMGGSVGYVSEPGKGACFHVELPLWTGGGQEEKPA